MRNTWRRGFEGGPKKWAVLQLKDTHGKRSSSMSFALRWKHENLRLIFKLAMISIAMTFMFLVLLYGTATKNVSVVCEWTRNHCAHEAMGPATPTG